MDGYINGWMDGSLNIFLLVKYSVVDRGGKAVTLLYETSLGFLETFLSLDFEPN